MTTYQVIRFDRDISIDVFPDITWTQYEYGYIGSIDLTIEQIGAFIDNHPNYFICFRPKEERIIISNKFFDQR